MMPRWSKGNDDPKELKADFDNATLMRERLSVMLQEDVDASLSKMRKYAVGEVLNLPEAYAHELSKQQTLLDIIKLIK